MAKVLSMKLLTLLPAALLCGCAGHGVDYSTAPRALSAAEIRAEVKACKSTGMVPRLVRMNGRVVWVQCEVPAEVSRG